MRWRSITIMISIALGACLGKTPADREKDAVVSVGRKGPTHNPGSPCLLCHGFAMAGTIYRYATDETGLSGVTVQVTDHAGHQFAAVSNSAGNFYVTVDSGLSAPAAGEREGQISIPWDVEFPAEVQLTYSGVTKKMRNQIGQWGSCAECHKPDLGATSNGRIYLEAAP